MGRTTSVSTQVSPIQSKVVVEGLEENLEGDFDTLFLLLGRLI